MKLPLRQALPPLIAFLLLYAAWDLSTRFLHIPPYLLPSPAAIWTETWGVSGAVAAHAVATLKTMLAGFLLSLAVGIPLALLIAGSSLAAAAIYPLLILVQSIPKVALAPILIVALGPTEVPRVIITFLVAFFPLVISTATGLLTTPPELIDLSRSLKASRMQVMLLVRLPYAVPHIFSGLKVAATLSVIGVVVAEFVAADSGLGYLIVSSMAFFNTALAFGAMLCLSVIAILAFQLIVLVQRAFFPWSMRD
jgi:NitT/TauT family transport system permease protein